MAYYQIHKLQEGLWAVEDGVVRMFLLDGGTGAFLMDTGCSGQDLMTAVRPLVSGEISVINTHCHGDHTAGNRFFRKFYMHEKDRADIRPACPADAEIITVTEGSRILTGNAKLEVIEIPGHTPGSIALLDRENRILFSGDMFAKGFPIYMQYPGQDMEKYHQSMLKVIERMPEYDRICPCHGELRLTKEDLYHVEQCCAGILNGTIYGEMMNDGSGSCIYRYQDVSILCSPKNGRD